MDDLTVTTESDRMQMDPPGLGEADHLGPDALQAGKIQVSLENHHLPEPKPNQGLVGSAKDWQLSMDLGKQLNLSKNILETRLRPNIVLVSESSKQVVMLELTVPWEEKMEEARERKKKKYAELVEECRNRGWRARCLPIEVGGRGFAGKSLCKAYSLHRSTQEESYLCSV